MLNSLISHVGPLQPGAQVQENSFTTCAGAAFIWDVSGLERASGIRPPGLPIVLIPRIPRTALGTIFVSGSVGWKEDNLLVFLIVFQSTTRYTYLYHTGAAILTGQWGTRMLNNFTTCAGQAFRTCATIFIRFGILTCAAVHTGLMSSAVI